MMKAVEPDNLCERMRQTFWEHFQINHFSRSQEMRYPAPYSSMINSRQMEIYVLRRFRFVDFMTLKKKVQSAKKLGLYPDVLVDIEKLYFDFTHEKVKRRE
jgi:hypothetical protein